LETKTINVNLADVEFMLDLPDGITIKDARVANGKLVLSIKTSLNVPDGSTVVYQHDEYGNTGLATFQ